jgi:hypothetical protein
MSTKPPRDLLYDSEATLRLVDSAIEEIGDLGASDPQPLSLRLVSPAGQSPALPIGLVGLSDLLARGYTEILGVLDSLRQSRHFLERATVEKLQHTHDKLREVSSATETAATDILNGLDRANAMVDELDALAAERGDGDERPAGVRNALRDELFALMGHMQFQDITSQQLSYASAVLTEMEERLASIARVFDPSGLGPSALGAAAGGGASPSVSSSPAVTFDPEATTQNREERQAMADEIIAARRASG